MPNIIDFAAARRRRGGVQPPERYGYEVLPEPAPSWLHVREYGYSAEALRGLAALNARCAAREAALRENTAAEAYGYQPTPPRGAA